jgi:hypothetical protein
MTLTKATSYSITTKWLVKNSRLLVVIMRSIMQLGTSNGMLEVWKLDPDFHSNLSGRGAEVRAATSQAQFTK